ncbi:MAG: LysR family transcriptional regulator [Pikeienuella sp.]
MSFDWNDLKPLLACAETGSLSAAAAQLGQSQPTLGRKVDALETALGVTLFDRGPRGMVLTDAGRDMLAHAQDVEAAAARMSLAAAGRSEAVEGAVRITASEVLSVYHLPEILTKIMDDRPGVELELVASNTSDNLLLREADIAVRMYRPEQGGLIARKVGDLQTGLYASDAYLARYGEPEVANFAQHHMVGYDRNPAIVDYVRDHDLPVTRTFFRLRTDNQIAYWQAVVAGAGIGAMQCSVADHTPGVRRVLSEVPLPALPVWLTTHEELRTSRLIRTVFDALADGLRAI